MHYINVIIHFKFRNTSILRIFYNEIMCASIMGIYNAHRYITFEHFWYIFCLSLIIRQTFLYEYFELKKLCRTIIRIRR